MKHESIKNLSHAHDMVQSAFMDLRRTNTLMDVAMQRAGIPVFELDSKGGILYANRAAIVALDCALQELKGRSMADLLEDEFMTQRRIAELAQSGDQQSWPSVLRLKTDTRYRCMVTGMAIRSPELQHQLRIMI